jgi:hypothetical protein
MVVLELVTVLLAALAVALAVAHALELPGKLRLQRDTYVAVQAIYYPGFTYAGASEILAVLAILALIIASHPSGARLGLLIAALALMALMHGAYWALTHPVNRFWTRGVSLDAFSGRFFEFDPIDREAHPAAAADGEALWRRARDRWELSHVIRAGLGAAGLVALLLASLR